MLARLGPSASTPSGVGGQKGLEGLLCNAVEHAMLLPLLPRWALQQADEPHSLFAALLAVAVREGGDAARSPTARFALRHLAGLLCHAALECRLEASLQGRPLAPEAITEPSLPAWGIAARLYRCVVRAFADRGKPHALRLLLMRCVKLAVHAEAARLQQSVAIHRHQALGECISQRLLRECGLVRQLVATLDRTHDDEAASAKKGGVDAIAPGGAGYVDLLLGALDTLPVVTWGVSHPPPAFEATWLKLLRRAGTPPLRPLVCGLFNWFAEAPAQFDHAAAVARWLSTGVDDGSSGSADEPPPRVSAEPYAWGHPQASTIQVARVARLILALVPSCEPPLQVAALDRLGALLDGSILNRSRCAEVRLLHQMLRLLATPLSEAGQVALLRALTPLASHSVSVSELKLLFSLLARPPPTAIGSAHHAQEGGSGGGGGGSSSSSGGSSSNSGGGLHSQLLTIISSMLRQHGPAASFLFDGIHSGLIVPPLPRLPPSGYAFCAWLRVDGFLHPPRHQRAGRPPRRPRRQTPPPPPLPATCRSSS